MKQLFVILALIVGFSFNAHAGKGALDGKTFAGKMVNPSGTYDDNLVFKDGKFTSKNCEEFGYKPGDYKAETKGDTTTFTSELKNDKGEMMSWTGEVKSDMVSAKGTEKDAAGKSEAFTYTGKVAMGDKTAAGAAKPGDKPAKANKAPEKTTEKKK